MESYLFIQIMHAGFAFHFLGLDSILLGSDGQGASMNKKSSMLMWHISGLSSLPQRQKHGAALVLTRAACLVPMELPQCHAVDVVE